MIRKMCLCPYWSRRWIVQEILLGDRRHDYVWRERLTWFSLKEFMHNLKGLEFLHMKNFLKDLSKSTPAVMSRYKIDILAPMSESKSLKELLIDFSRRHVPCRTTRYTRC